MFLDLTPVDHRVFPLPEIGEPRKELPEWAEIFSPSFINCKPSVDDVKVGINVLNAYLFEFLPSITKKDYSKKQQAYIDGQRKNTTTLKTLKSLVGEETATEFFTEVLFPDIV